MTFTLSPEREKLLDQIIARYPEKRAACLPALQLCQEQTGHIEEAAVAWVAEKLALSTAQVQGVVTFYTMFQQKKVAPNVVWICRTLSCELMGAKAVQQALETKLGCHAGETSKDGKVTLLKAECLAACGYGPMMQLNDEYHLALTPEKAVEIVEAAKDRARDLPIGDPGGWQFGPQGGGTR